MIETITQLLSWFSILLAIAGISLMLFDVLPRQYKLYKIADEYSFERKRLPVLSTSFVILGMMVGSAIIFNTLTGINGHNTYANLTRIGVNLLIFHGGFTWASLYNRVKNI